MSFRKCLLSLVWSKRSCTTQKVPFSTKIGIPQNNVCNNLKAGKWEVGQSGDLEKKCLF